MKTDNYLYGDVEVPEIDTYVILRRIELLNDNLSELLEVHYFSRDTKRVHDILRAISFWENINQGEHNG